MHKQDSSVVSIELKQQLGVISINYAPVNALSQPVRAGLMAAIAELNQQTQVKVILICCQGRTFIAGADIKEFGKPPMEPSLPDVVNAIENSQKPVIASLFGTSLGGGLEVALACHYRVASSGAKVGLPEVNLGLMPGAGGTQRLPRIVGARKAVEMVTSGKHYGVNALGDSGLIDLIVDDNEDLAQATETFALQLIAGNQLQPKPVGSLSIADAEFDWQSEKQLVVKKARGQNAPVAAFDVMEKTKSTDIKTGMAMEREQFVALRGSEQSAALRHAFAAEKLAPKLSFEAELLNVESIGVVGGGNMGSGIATAFLSSGFKLCLIEQNQQALDAGLERIRHTFDSNVKKGRMSQSQVDAILNNLSGDVNHQALADADLVIEAVFESMEVKKALFKSLDSVCKSDAILATNTSYLDIDEIAAVTNRPEFVVGMHFFSPANIMKLLEVVRAKHTSEEVLATAMAVGKKLKKISVQVGVCFGFAGNRMYTRYGREVQQMLLEGASVEQIDNAMTSWGMAMGPLAVQDLSGIDIGHNARSSQPFPEHDPGYFRAAATMVEAGRLGRKTGAGFYQYDDNGKPQMDPEVKRLLNERSESLAIKQITFTEQDIVHRALFALISEGLSLLKEGIAQRMSDIDVIWMSGYGFPRYKGGPMFQAKVMGAKTVEEALDTLRLTYSEKIWPPVDCQLLNQ